VFAVRSSPRPGNTQATRNLSAISLNLAGRASRFFDTDSPAARRTLAPIVTNGYRGARGAPPIRWKPGLAAGTPSDPGRGSEIDVPFRFGFSQPQDEKNENQFKCGNLVSNSTPRTNCCRRGGEAEDARVHPPRGNLRDGRAQQDRRTAGQSSAAPKAKRRPNWGHLTPFPIQTQRQRDLARGPRLECEFGATIELPKSLQNWPGPADVTHANARRTLTGPERPRTTGASV